MGRFFFQCDLAKEGLVKNTAQMDKYCEDKGFIGWFETSAKDNINIDNACRALVKRIRENDISSTDKEEPSNAVSLTDGGAPKDGCSC